MSLMFAALKKLDSPTGSTGVAAGVTAAATTSATVPRISNAARTLGLPALAIGGALLTAWWWYPAHQQTLATEQPGATSVPTTAAPARVTAVDDTVNTALELAEPANTAADMAAATTAVPGSSTPLQPSATTPMPSILANAPDPVAPPVDMPATAAPPTTFQITRAAPETTPESGSVTEASATSVVVSALPRGPIAVIEADQPSTPPVTAKPASSHRALARQPPRLPSERIVVRHVADQAQAAPAIDTPQGHTGGQTVAQIITALGAAIEAGDFATGQQQLDQLTARLPQESLTLLRMQAWFAHESGDTASAVAMYRRIIKRVPHDKTAAINLALLETRKGLADSARDRLRHLRAVGTESREIKRAMTRVESQLQ